MEGGTFLEKSNTVKVGLQKNEIRARYLKLLKSLPQERYNGSKERILQALQPKLAPFSSIVSFINFSYEVDLSAINGWISSHKELFLPRWEEQFGNRLDIYCAKGGEIGNNRYDCILVPALAFDKDGVRVGHGRGCYDRLLTEHPYAHTIGIGFYEQFSEKGLPREPHDKVVKECCFV